MAVRKRHQLWGETLREIGLLVMAFTPLDYLFKGGQRIDPVIILIGLIGGLILIVVGVEIETGG